MIHAITRPKSTPRASPMPNCIPSSRSSESPRSDWGAIRYWISIMVRKIAVGSLVPDSISSVLATRWLSRVPLVRSRLNTAAASVEPTMAPSSRPAAH